MGPSLVCVMRCSDFLHNIHYGSVVYARIVNAESYVRLVLWTFFLVSFCVYAARVLNSPYLTPYGDGKERDESVNYAERSPIEASSSPSYNGYPSTSPHNCKGSLQVVSKARQRVLESS